MSQELLFGGIDIGASATKVALLNDGRGLLASDIRKTGVSFETCAQEAMEAALASCGRKFGDLSRVVSTGYGRHNVKFAHGTRTEIACHSKAAHFAFPRAITVVDVGGQDNKIIHLDAEGRRNHFKMNRKCAAGTGAFLEEVAQRMDVPLDQMDPLARQASHIVHMGSYCTVFTKTEILAHLRAGEKVPEIVAGLVDSVAKRIIEMDPLNGEVVISGGVVDHIPVLAEMLARHLGHPVHILPNAQLAGAFGAALFAAEDHTK
ncbi:MAG: acyl-CoA dehydratase activase [Acidobacteriota bacterium]|nr:acyl-CoA dehydratase activase [Acidobacteriota bacterium]